MLIGILILVQYTFQAPVTASQPETEQGVTFSGEIGTESGETEEATETIIEISTEIVVSEGGITETSEEEQIEATTEVVNSEENSEENEYTTSEENAGEGTTEVFTSEEVTTEEKTTEGTGIGWAITRTVGGSTTPADSSIKDINLVSENTLAPYNRLKILTESEAPNATVTYISAEDDGLEHNAEGDSIVTVGKDSPKSDAAVYHGDWSKATSTIYSEFEGSYSAIAVRFCGSNTTLDHYNDYATVGWNEDWQDIDKTKMQIIVEYKNNVTYDGKPVVCIAKFRVTPFKNRSAKNGNKYGSDSEGEYSGNYYPLLQISALLHNGWVWQNVRDCQVSLQFYFASTYESYENPGEVISLSETDYTNDYIGNYYTINSLNPEGNNTQNENPAPYYGPEYVLPQGNNSVYAVEQLDLGDGTTSDTHITTSYSKGPDWAGFNGIQYAYSGGTAEWTTDDDKPGSTKWKLNSVTIMPDEQQDALVFTMGQLIRDPSGEYNAQGIYRTANMWASIETEPFGETRTLIDITVTKKWKNIDDSDADTQNCSPVKISLCRKYLKKGATESTEDVLETKEVSNDSNWQCTFQNLIPEAYLKDTIDDAESAEYIIKEEVPGGYEYVIAKTFENVEVKTGEDSDQIKNINFEITNKPITGKITIKKLGVNDIALPGVTYKLQKMKDSSLSEVEKEYEPETTAIDSDGKAICTFDNLDEGNYLITEIKTVSGYNLLKEPIEITIPYKPSDNTSINPEVYGGYQKINDEDCYYHITYTVINTQYMALPESGGGLRMILQICGVVLIGTSIISYFVYRKKEKGKGDD